MVNRGQCFVRAIDVNGKWDSIDVLDLDEESFRRFVLTKLHRHGSCTIIKNDEESGPLYEKQKKC